MDESKPSLFDCTQAEQAEQAKENKSSLRGSTTPPTFYDDLLRCGTQLKDEIERIIEAVSSKHRQELIDAYARGWGDCKFYNDISIKESDAYKKFIDSCQESKLEESTANSEKCTEYKDGKCTIDGDSCHYCQKD